MINRLGECKWLYLRSIGEPRDNSLRLIIEEARSGDVSEAIEIVPGAQLNGRPIEHADACRVFEVLWANYVAYSVTNESYDTPDEPDTYTGKLVRRYSKSSFLEYVARSTFATEDYPGPLAHIAVLCLNHSINVVSTESPKVRLIKHGRPLPVKPAQQSVEPDRREDAAQR
jgi:hypothetical protein